MATADTTGTGALDFAVARQWGPPAFYANESPNRGDYLDLRLYRPATGGQTSSGLAGLGAPAYGTTVTVTLPNGSADLPARRRRRPRRFPQLRRPLRTRKRHVAGVGHAELDGHRSGGRTTETEQLTPGTHSLLLTSPHRRLRPDDRHRWQAVEPRRRPPSRPAPAAPPRRPARKDPRYLALRNFAISITVFNVFGYTLLGFEQPWLWPIFAVLIGYTTEIVASN